MKGLILSRADLDEERKVATFNAEILIGSPVSYRDDAGNVIETHTRSKASLLSGHTAVVWLENVRGCVAVDRVTPRETASI